MPTSTADSVTIARCPLASGDLDPDLQRLLGFHFRHGFETHRELSGAAIERQVEQSQGTRRRYLLATVAGTQHHHRDVEIMPRPGLVERDVDGRAVGADRQPADPQRPVALDRYQRFAGMRRGDRQAGRVADGIGGLVELERYPVGAYTLGLVVLCRPAGIEAEAHRLPGSGSRISTR
jgi:hypothetical protein